MNQGISQNLFVISALLWRQFQVHPDFCPALWRVPKLITITSFVHPYQSSEIPVTLVPFIRDPIYSEGWPACPLTVLYSPEIDASKFTLHILSDTPGVFQRLKCSLLMMEYLDSDCRRCLWTIRDSPENDDWLNSQIHSEAVIEQDWTCRCRAWSSKFAHPLWGQNRASLKIHHLQNVIRSGSHTQSSQTLRATLPARPSSSRRSKTLLELRNLLSDSARAFSGAPESTCSYGGALRMLHLE